MKILIVDDEALARNRLRTLITELDVGKVIGEAATGQETLSQVELKEPDIILLDIRMPGMDGIETADHLSKLANPPAVIFTTAYDEYTLKAFEAHAVDYLLKPIRKHRLAEALAVASRLTRAQLSAMQSAQQKMRTHISARVQGNIKLIPIENILYLQAEQKYVTVRHLEGEVLIDEPLKALEQEFSQRFIRVHRNALVAKDYIEALEKTKDANVQIKLRSSETRLKVSRRHLPNVRKWVKGPK